MAKPERMSSAKFQRDHVPAYARVQPKRALAKRKPGQAAEDSLAALLESAGWLVQTYPEWLRAVVLGQHWRTVVVREFPVGLLCEPTRRFRCDFLCLWGALAIEIEGGVHGVQKQRKSDIKREQLIQAAGVRVLRVLPEQVKDGTALDLVKRALETRDE